MIIPIAARFSLSLALLMPLSLPVWAATPVFEPTLSAPPSCDSSDETCLIITENQTGSLQDLGDLNFDGIIEDSRCPLDVLCFWEGQVRVGMNYNYQGVVQKFEVGLGAALNPQWINPETGLNVRLEQVWPEKILANPSTEPYQIKLKINRYGPQNPGPDGPEQDNGEQNNIEQNDAVQDNARQEAPLPNATDAQG